MELQSLQAIVVDALEDIKAQDIHLYDTTGLTSLFDRVAIVSGTSNRQTRALANHVRDKVKAAGGHVISVEGEETGEWVLVDLGDIVVHVMQPAIRAYYNLEELWGGHRLELHPPKPIVRKSARKAAEAAAAVAAEATASAPAAPVRKRGPRPDQVPAEAPAPKRKPRTSPAIAGKSTAKAPRPSTRSPRKEAAGEPARKAPARKAAGEGARAPARKAPARKPATAGSGARKSKTRA